MKFCLFYLPHSYSSSFILHETQSKFEGVLPPYTLMVVAAAAERAGHEVKILDCNQLEIGPGEAVRRAAQWGAQALGFSVTTYNLNRYLDFMAEVRARTDIPVIAGGRQFLYYPMETMSHTQIDYAVAGEGDITIGELLDAMEGKRDIDSVDGIMYREGTEVKVTPPRGQVADLDSLPFPARHLVDNSKYFNVLSPLRNFTLTMVSRDCPHRCTFCDMGKTKYRHRSVENVMEELRQCAGEFGVRAVDFQDSTFNAAPAFTKELCRAMAREKLGLKFMVRAHVKTLDEEMAELLKEAGCFLMLLGIESGNDEILKKVKKGVTTEQTRRAVEMAARHRIGVMGYFVFGLPGDTMATMRETLDYSLSLPLNFAQYTRLIPMPNTEIYNEYIKATGRDFWREFTLDPRVEYETPMLDSGISVETATALQNYAYKKFYLRPSRILKIIMMKIRTPLELLRLVPAAISLLTRKKRVVTVTPKKKPTGNGGRGN